MELDIFDKGKEYISASRAAEKLGYASDYIGQLCRAGKVPGRLIGRTWYVDLPSLAAHKASRQAGKRKNLEPSPIALRTPLASSAIVFEADDRPLLPSLIKFIPPPAPRERRVARDAAAFALSLTLAFSAGFATLDRTSPVVAENIENRLARLSLTSEGFARGLARDAAATQVAAVSFFNALSDSAEFITDSFRTLRQMAFGSSGSGTEESPGALAQAPASQGATEGASTLDAEALKMELQAELESYIKTQLSSLATPAPRIVYQSSSPVINTAAIREEILRTDIRPSITRQSDSDVGGLSTVITQLADGAAFTNTSVSGTFSGTADLTTFTFTNATGTNATTTNLHVSGLASTTELRANTGSIGSLSSVFGTFTNLLVNGSSTLQTFGATYASTTQIQSTGQAYFATAGGSVGIGTTNPTSLLDVNGAISGTSVTGTASSISGTASLRAGASNVGLRGGAGFLQIVAGGSDVAQFHTSLIQMAAGIPFGWAAATIGGNNDTSISRLSAGVMAIGTGLQGSYAGTLAVANINGGTAANDDITIQGTSHSTRDTSYVNLQPNGGNVGIGTTNPGTKLDVLGSAGTADGRTILKVTDNTYATLRIAIADSGTIQYASNEGAHILAFGGKSSDLGTFTPRFTINNVTGNSYFNSGNVGIGTTNPSKKLSVVGTTTVGLAADSYSFLDVTNALNAGGQNLVVGTNGGDTSIMILDSQNYSDTNGPKGLVFAGKYHSAFDGLNSGLITFGAITGVHEGAVGAQRGGLKFSTGGTSLSEKMRLDNDGNLGIGISTPGAKLDVVDANTSSIVRLRRVERTNGTTLGGLLFNGGNAASVSNSADYANIAGLILDNSASAHGGALVLQTATAGTLTEKVRIDNNGKLGIGTTSPMAKLSVHGLGTDNGSYLFAIASSTSAFATTTHMVVTSAGNVGIGTTTPYRLLSVSGTGNVYGAFGSTNTTGAGIEVFDTGSRWLMQADSGVNLAGALAFYSMTASAYRMVIDGSGNVGIGTTNPGAKLEAYGDGHQIITNFPSASSYGGMILKQAGTAKAYVTLVGSAGLTADRYDNLEITTGSSNSGGEIDFRPLDVSAMRISTTGNVGIGTTNPTTGKLEITQSSASAYGLIVSKPTASVGTVSTIRAVGYTPSFELLDKDAVQNWYMSLDDADSDKFKIGRGYSPNQGANVAMTIDTSDRVGIGTTNPTATFQVNNQGFSQTTIAGVTGLLVQAQGARTRFAIAPGTGTLSDDFLFATTDVTTNYEYLARGLDGGTATWFLSSGKGGTGTLHPLVFDATGVTSPQFKQVYLATSGNVGIGTTSPMAKLSVHGLGTDNGSYLFTIASSTSAFATTTHMVVTSAGNVGIGTTNPSQKLHVLNSGNSVVLIESNTSGVPSFQLRQSQNGVDEKNFDFIVNASKQMLGRAVNDANTAATNFIEVSRGTGTAITSVAFPNGNVGIGTTDPGAYKLNVNGKTSLGAGADADILDLQGNGYIGTMGLDGTGMYWKHNSSVRDIRVIANTGGVVLAAGATSWAAISDERLKDIVAPLESAADKLMNLRTIYYTLKGDETGTPHIGLIAQEVQAVYPEAVSAGSDGFLSLRYSELIVPIIKAIQEIVQITGVFKDNLIAWMGDATNGIQKFFAKEVYAEKLCLKNSLGADVCVTGDELTALMNSANGSSGGGIVTTTPSQELSPTSPDGSAGRAEAPAEDPESQQDTETEPVQEAQTPASEESPIEEPVVEESPAPVEETPSTP